MLRGVFWHLFFEDLSQSEKLSEIKPPLGSLCSRKTNTNQGQLLLLATVRGTKEVTRSILLTGQILECLHLWSFKLRTANKQSTKRKPSTFLLGIIEDSSLKIRRYQNSNQNSIQVLLLKNVSEFNDTIVLFLFQLHIVDHILSNCNHGRTTKMLLVSIVRAKITIMLKIKKFLKSFLSHIGNIK